MIQGRCKPNEFRGELRSQIHHAFAWHPFEAYSFPHYIFPFLSGVELAGNSHPLSLTTASPAALQRQKFIVR
jgi:hypothetical protein